MTGRTVLIAGVIVGCFSCMTVREAGAAEWSAEPSVSVRGDYNSNLLLSGVSREEIWGHWTSPGVTFAGSSENLRISGRAAADFVSYYGARDVSFTNLYFPLAIDYQGERDAISVNGGLTRDNTLMGELQQTGLVLAFTQRNQWTASPSWTRNVTERTALVAGYQFAQATYENGLRFGLIDYTTHGGNAGVTYQIAEKTQISLMSVGTLFQAPRTHLETQIYGAQFTLNHDFSDSMRVKVQAGPRFITNAVEAGAVTLTDRSWVGVANASFQKQLERTTFTLDASRDLNPSGFGLLIQTDRVGVKVDHRLTEHLNASIYGQVLVASSVATTGFSISIPETRYSSIQPKLSWRIDEWWTAEAWYTYARRDVEEFKETGISHAVTFVLTYIPAKFSVGR